MKIPYWFLDEDHFESDTPHIFIDDDGPYVIIQARTKPHIKDQFTFLRSGVDEEDAKHNLWEALWAVFNKYPDRPEIPLPSEEDWIPSDVKEGFVEYD